MIAYNTFFFYNKYIYMSSSNTSSSFLFSLISSPFLTSSDYSFNELFSLKEYINENYNDTGILFLNDIDILSRLYHPHLLHSLFLFSPSSSPSFSNLSLLLPLSTNSLSSLFNDHTMSTSQKLPILFKIAHAIHFLHSHRFLFLNLSPSSVSFSSPSHPFLSNFHHSLYLSSFSPPFSLSSFSSFTHLPPELLSSSPSSPCFSSDSWSFGLLLFSFITNNNIYNSSLSPSSFLLSLSDLFSPSSLSSTLDSSLINVSPSLSPLVKNLLSSLLSFDPTQRLSFSQILTHDLFSSFSFSSIPSSLIPPFILSYHPDHRSIIKLIIYWCQSFFSSLSSELLFLSCDLFFRVSPFFSSSSSIFLMSLAVSCIWISLKFLYSSLSSSFSLSSFLPPFLSLHPSLSSSILLSTELDILYYLNGIININSLYLSCSNKLHLHLSLQHIILHSDSSFYLSVDFPSWSNILSLYPSPVSLPISISSLFSNST